MKKYVPLYLYSGDYARQQNELDAYRASWRENQECQRAIDKIISENFDGIRLAKGIEEQIIDRFGKERTAYILANTVRQMSYDGRYGPDNKEWALTVTVHPNMAMGYDRNMELTLRSHPAVLDGFIRHARRVMNGME